MTTHVNLERWPSGLRRTLGKRVKGQLFRGFESHSLRQVKYLKTLKLKNCLFFNSQECYKYIRIKMNNISVILLLFHTRKNLIENLKQYKDFKVLILDQSNDLKLKKKN